MSRARCRCCLVLCLALAASGCYARSSSAPARPRDATPATNPIDAAAPAAPPSPLPSAAPAHRSIATHPSVSDATAASPPTLLTLPQPLTSTRRGLRVAFLGDQGIGDPARSVLQLVARENADALVHLGDFAYDEAPPADWDAQVDSILGPDFPYFAAIGNHDVLSWPGPGGFAELLNARVARIPGARCTGEYGVKSVCNFRGLDMVLSGVGTYGTDHEAFIEDSLSHSKAAFRLCLWHKNQHDMQAGAKADEVGWQAYKICAHYAAPVITGHEHSYARTMTLAAIGDKTLAHGPLGDPASLLLAPNRTAVFIVGLGGQSMRARTDDHVNDSWWASMYAQNYQLQNGRVTGTEPTISYGAMFIDFNVDDDPYRARGYFKTTDGQVQDRFTIQVPRETSP